MWGFRFLCYDAVGKWFPTKGFRKFDKWFPTKGFRKFEKWFPTKGFRKFDKWFPTKGFRKFDKWFPTKGFRKFDKWFPTKGFRKFDKRLPSKAAVYTRVTEISASSWSKHECALSYVQLHSRLYQCFSIFVRPRPGKFFFHKTRARSQRIYS